MFPVKPYSLVPIRECGEPLVAIPRDVFAFFDPHPYVALNAPYGGSCPWMLRKSVLKALLKTQRTLQSRHPGWSIKIFDAYRPNAVQEFMAAREFAALARAEGLDPAALSPAERERLAPRVYRVFAIPSNDPSTPPPHSTGAAIDCTIADDAGRDIDMGSPIDENSERSYPDAFASVPGPAHANRALLNDVMQSAGFRRNPGEWWHFSRGDQLAVWAEHGNAPDRHAIYGRVPTPD